MRKFWLSSVAPWSILAMEGEGGGSAGGAGDGEVKRPEFIPEKFWDAEKKAPRVEQLAKSYVELEGRFGKRAEELEPEIRKKVETERFAKRPAKADDYALPDVTKFEDVKLPTGVSVNLIKDHPLLGFWRNHAWQNGYTQEQFDAGIKDFIKAEVTGLEGIDSQMNQLGTGEEAKKRVQRVDAFISEHLEDDKDYAAMVDMLRTASQVAAFEKLMKKIGKEPDLTKWNGRQHKGVVNTGGDLTLAQLRELQNKPEYYRDHDPAIVKQVQEGYKKLSAARRKG